MDSLLKKMKIPEGERVCCAADMLEYDETQKLDLRKFFSHYKDQFPILIVIIGGHYGETKFDCYDNFQVLRINCYTAQPRVIAEDPRLNPRHHKGYITIPEDTSIKYRLIKGHTKLGNPQPLRELLEQNDRLPLLVQMACDSQYPIRVGNSRQMARDFGHIMIKEKYMEHFLMMNAIDGVGLKMNKLICMACLCEELEATPVTGFKYASKADFDEFCQILSKDVSESGEIYDTTTGNEDYSEYSFDEMRYLIQISDYSTGLLTDGAEAEDSDESDDYEEMPPELPSRNPLPPRRKKIKTNATESSQQASQSHNSPKSPKLHNKHLKGAFSFLRKKHRNESENGQAKPIIEVPKPIKEVPKPTIKPKPEIPKSQSHEVNSEPKVSKVPSQEKKAVPTVPEKKTFPDPNVDTKAGYVMLTSPPTTYINTQIGRATVKPMLKTTNVGQDGNGIPTQIEDNDEDYEAVDCIPGVKKKMASVTSQNNNSSLLAELTSKIGQDNAKTIEEEEEEEDNGNYEVVGMLDNDEYLVPIQHSQNPLRRPLPSTPVSNSSNFDNHHYANDIKSLTIDDVRESLKALNLEKYAEEFRDNRIDGEILVSLSVDDFTKELGLKKLEAIRLHKFAKTGHIPK